MWVHILSARRSLHPLAPPSNVRPPIVALARIGNLDSHAGLLCVYESTAKRHLLSVQRRLLGAPVLVCMFWPLSPHPCPLPVSPAYLRPTSLARQACAIREKARIGSTHRQVVRLAFPVSWADRHLPDRLLDPTTHQPCSKFKLALFTFSAAS